MNTAFLLSWIVFPIAWFKLLRFTDLSIKKFSIPQFLLIFIFLTNYIGLPILYFELDRFRLSEISNLEIIVNVFCFNSLAITFLIIGYIFGTFCAKSDLFFVNDSSDRIYKFSERRFYILFIFLFSIVSATLYFYVSSIGFQDLAITSLITSVNSLDPLMARSSMAAINNAHWYELIFLHGLTFLTFIAISASIITKNKIIIAFSIASILLLLFVAIISTQKGPILKVFMGFWIVYVFSKSKDEISLFSVISFGMIFAAIIILVYYLLSDLDSNFFEILLLVLSRIFTGFIQSTYYYLELFPGKIDWLLGTTFPNPGGILPFTPFNLTQEVMAWIAPNEIAIGIDGSSPAIYWAEVFANFNFWGIPIISFLIGFFLQTLHLFLYLRKNDPLHIAFYSWLMLHYMDLSITSLSNYLLDIKVTFILILFIISFFTLLNEKKN